jgi:hypothetical protein
MHRLFVLEPLKRQRNLHLGDPLRKKGVETGWRGFCCSIAAAFMLQKSTDLDSQQGVQKI